MMRSWIANCIFVQMMEGSRVVAERLGLGVSWVLWLLMPLMIVISPAALAYGIRQHREGGPYVPSREAQNRGVEEAKRRAQEHPITPDQMEALRSALPTAADPTYSPMRPPPVRTT